AGGHSSMRVRGYELSRIQRTARPTRAVEAAQSTIRSNGPTTRSATECPERFNAIVRIAAHFRGSSPSREGFPNCSYAVHLHNLGNAEFETETLLEVRDEIHVGDAVPLGHVLQGQIVAQFELIVSQNVPEHCRQGVFD